MNKPARRPQGGLEKAAGIVASLLFIAFVVWLANGVVQGGWVMWFAIVLFAAPVVGLLGFYAWIFVAFVLVGRRNVREAERARREES